MAKPLLIKEIEKKVIRTGDEMLGPLVLQTEPIEDLHAVTKQYVDQVSFEGNDALIDYVDNAIEQHNIAEDSHVNLQELIPDAPEDIGAAPEVHAHNSLIEWNNNQEQKFWQGTREEYEQLEIIDENTMYLVTGDSFGPNIVGADEIEYSGSLTGIKAKNIQGALDESFFTLKDYTDDSINSHDEVIKNLIQELADRLNWIANSTDEDLDQLAELVAFISENRDFIGEITENKINISDIVNDLETGGDNKPLSAEQGKVLNNLINAIHIPALVSELENDANYLINSEISDWAKAETKPEYNYDEVNAAPSIHTHTIADVINLQTALDDKAAASHTHTIANIINLQTTLDGKAASSHNHDANNITSGTLPVTRGGTGITSNPSALINLASTSAASLFAASPRPGVTGTLPIANGGTGATTAAAALTNLGITATATELNYVDGVTSNVQTQLNGKAASSHNHDASNITSGTLSAARGGTGQSSLYPAVGTYGVRGIAAGTSDLTAGSSSLSTGAIYLVYE